LSTRGDQRDAALGTIAVDQKAFNLNCADPDCGCDVHSRGGNAALNARRLTLWTFGLKAVLLLIEKKVNRDRQGPVPPI
jgi:hypothetical protein